MPRYSQRRGDVDPDRPDLITGPIESRDVRAVAREMVADLLEIPEIQRAIGRPRIGVTKVTNRTRHRIDTTLFTTLMRDELLQNAKEQIAFVDSSVDRQSDPMRNRRIERERERKRRGEVDSSKVSPRAGIDFFLAGDLKGHSVGSPRGVSDWIVFSFRLIDGETYEVIWSRNYQKKSDGQWGSGYSGLDR